MPLTSVKNPADLANVCLARLGWKGGDIGNLYEGSAAANVILDVYGQVRDALLRAMSPDFAQTTVSLTLQKSAPAGGYIPGVTPWSSAYPPPGWLFQYLYPDDCIKVRAVKPVAIFFPNFDPSPNVFSIANDPSLVPAQEVILCNVENAACVYTRRVTDPTQWAVDFTDAMIDSLTETAAPSLANLQTAQMAAGEAVRSEAVAKMEQG